MDIISVYMKSKDTNKPPSTIYSELAQTKPFDRMERELAVVILRTGDVLHHSITRALAAWDLSNEQYNALRILRGAGDGGRPTLDISNRLISRSPNITRLLDKLISKGLARRDRDAADRRQAVVRITPQGKELLDRCDGDVDAVVGKIRTLNPDEMRVAVGLLDRVRSAVAVTTVSEELRGRKTSETTQEPKR
jgi:DNA-binding MarR family transcriptional regulator